jgi:4-diphosphocytidyl-2C-methyl-D-erythritol kinase
MNLLHLRAYAKLNLTLAICAKQGKFHPIKSVMQSVSLYDELTFLRGGGDLRVFYDEPYPIPLKENLVWKAMRMMKEHFPTPYGMNVWLRKRIPPGSGMGGASADAAATLNAVNRLWELGLSDSEMLDLGTRIGNDFTAVICRRFPSAATSMDRIKATGALSASVTGSGSAIFGVFDDEGNARRAAILLRADNIGEIHMVQPVTSGMKEVDE